MDLRGFFRREDSDRDSSSGDRQEQFRTTLIGLLGVYFLYLGVKEAIALYHGTPAFTPKGSILYICACAGLALIAFAIAALLLRYAKRQEQEKREADEAETQEASGAEAQEPTESNDQTTP